jgi:hypothetical protein
MLIPVQKLLAKLKLVAMLRVNAILVIAGG